MQAFDYVAVRRIDEAVDLLAEHREKARILSGGTDLLVQLRERRKHADVLIDIKSVPELTRLELNETGLVVGGAVPCYRIYEHPEIARLYPGLVDAASLIGGIQIQSRATLGGNLCNASPAADSIPSLIAHRATCLIQRRGARREVPVEEFCTAPGQTTLQPDEMLISLHLPYPAPRTAGAYQRFTPRNEMDIAVVGVGATVTLSEDGTTLEAVRIGLGAVAPTPLRVRDAEAAAAGQPVSEAAIDRLAAIAQASANPITDMRGSATQRKHLVGVLTRRVLHVALERARTL